MKWGPHAIAGYAEAAGFTTDLAMAVAVALAASDGDDGYVARSWGGADRLLVGLWQIPADNDPDGAWTQLRDPYANARAARALYLEAGDGWGWCAGYQTGQWRVRYAPAVAAVKSGRRTDDAPDPYAFNI